jgi:hypothetical protein
MLRSVRRNALAASALLCVAAAVLGATDSTVAAGTVDIQFSLCDTLPHIERTLGLRPHGLATEVWLFDNPTLALYSKGLRLRLRGSGATEDLTLKAGDQDCARLPAGTLSAGGGKCENDLHGTVSSGALSLTITVDPQTAGELTAGRLPVAQALGAAQREFLQRQPGVWPLAADTRPLGPSQVRSYRARKLKYDVDVSTLPGEQRFIEISRKVPLADAARLRERFEAELARAGVVVCADQTAQAGNKLRLLLARP